MGKNNLKTPAWVLAIAFSVVACKEQEARVYYAPKEVAQVGSGGSRPGVASSADIPRGGKPKWKVPEGWREKAADGMRVGSFEVPGEENQRLDISVIPLSGRSGSELDNVNRWRGQVKLA